jgi:hypothetical protein
MLSPPVTHHDLPILKATDEFVVISQKKLLLAFLPRQTFVCMNVAVQAPQPESRTIR